MSRSLILAVIDRCLSVSNSLDELALIGSVIRDPRLDWLSVVSLANKHLVAPALWTTLSRPSFFELVPQDVRNYLAFLHARNAARNARIRQQCLDIGLTLARAGSRAVLLKGAAWLFDGNSPAASDRMMQDIDLAVAPQEFEPAVRTLAAAGYREASGLYTQVGHFHHAPMLCEGAEAIVEIHRDLSNRIEFLSTPEVIASAREVAPGLLLPKSGHRIVYNVIHAQIMNGDFAGGVLNLRDGLDLARLIAGSGPEFDWSALAQEARDRGYFRHLSGAIHAAHQILRSPLPPPFADHPWGRLHAWRCIQQRQWPRINKVLGTLGLLARGLAWQRDAYPLGLKSRRSLRAQMLVNRRRAQRALAAVRNNFTEGAWRATDQPNYRGLFINLDRSADRRRRMEAQLRKFNLQERYSRFSAVDGRNFTNAPGAVTAGEYGCFRSHYLALESAKSMDATIHIVEDDVDLVPQVEQIISSLEACGLLDHFDIIFTDTAIGLDLGLLRKYNQLFDAFRRGRPRELSVLSLNKDYLWGTESYLVPRAAIDKVLSVFRGGLEAGPNLPIDVFIREEAQQGRLQLGCIFPFITAVQLDEVARTTIGRTKEHTSQKEILSLLRYSFFLGGDLENLPPSLLERLHAHDNDDHHRLIASVLGLLVSSKDS